VSCYSKITGKFKNYHLTNPNGLSVEANLIYNILCDRHGVIWCSSSAGIFEYDPRQDNFKGYYHSESNPASISSDRIFKNSFVEDPVKDGIWISGPNGINFLDLKTKIFYNYRNNPDKNPIFFNQEIYPLTFDHHNNLWFSIRFKSELYCYDFIQQTLTKEIIHSNEKKASAPFNVATLFFDSKGNTWFSTWSTKVYFREKNQVEFSRVVHDDINPNSINSSFFWDVMEDADGTLWFGGLNGYLNFNPLLNFILY
jgi:ligand-binding sensor domain-containing protein